MELRQELIYESIRRSFGALGEPPLNLPEIAPLRAQLGQAMLTIGELSTIQRNLKGRRTGTGPEVEKLRDEIGKRLRQVSSHAIVCLDGLPGIRDEVRPPRMNAAHDKLLEGTARLIRNVRPHLDALYANGLARNSIERLEALARELDEKVQAPNLAIAERSRATNALPDALARGRDVIRAIDSSMKLILADDPPAMRVWETVKRIPAKRGRPKQRRTGGHTGEP